MSVHVRGQPIHVILNRFPLALFLTATVFDAVYVAGGGAGWYTASYYTLVGGFVSAVPTIIFGFFDYSLMKDKRARAVATRHMVAALSATGAFFISLLFRSILATPAVPPPDLVFGAAFGLSIFGAGVLTIGIWLGGELVYRHRVGVGIEPPDHYEPHPAKDEAGNVAQEFKDYPSADVA